MDVVPVSFIVQQMNIPQWGGGRGTPWTFVSLCGWGEGNYDLSYIPLQFQITMPITNSIYFTEDIFTWSHLNLD